MRFLPLVEGMMPVQFVVELAVLFAVLTLATYLLQRRGYRLNKLLQATTAFAVLFLYLRYRLYPPLPFSVLATYLVVSAFGIWGWVSSNEAYWEDFRRPIIAVVNGQTRALRAARAVVLVLLPLLVGAWAYSTMRPPDPGTNAPVDLRIYHPAPPATITVYSPEDFRR